MRWPFLLWFFGVVAGVGVAIRGTILVCGSGATDCASLAHVFFTLGDSPEAVEDAGDWVWVRLGDGSIEDWPLPTDE